MPNKKEMKVSDAYTVMASMGKALLSAKEEDYDSMSDVLILMETVVIGLLYLEYPTVVMDKIGPVIKAAVKRTADEYAKHKGAGVPMSDFYSFFLRNSYRNCIYSSLAGLSATGGEGKNYSDEAVTKLMEIRQDIGDSPSRYCSPVVYGILSTSLSNAKAVGFGPNGEKMDDESIQKGIASQTAAGILAYKSFLMDVAASDGVEFSGKRIKGICMDSKFFFTNSSNCAEFVSSVIASQCMDALIDASDKFASMSLGIAEAASFKSSKDLEQHIKDRVDAYATECAGDKDKFMKKLEADEDVQRIAKEVEGRFDSYMTDVKNNASKASSVFSSGAYEILGRVRSILISS